MRFTLVVVAAIIAASGCFSASSRALAQSSADTITYQGVLTTNGTPVPDGAVSLTFRIHDVATGGTPLHEVTVTGVAVSGGRFTSLVPVPPGLFPQSANSDWYIGVVYNNVELLPRQLLTSTPLAMAASNLHNRGGSGPLTTGLLSELPVEGQIAEGRWGNYLVSSNGNDRQLRIGVSNDGFTRALIRLENDNATSGRIVMSTTAGASNSLIERFSIERDGGVLVNNSTLFVRNVDAPSGDRVWGLVVRSSDGDFQIGQNDSNSPSTGTLSRVPFRIEPAATTDMLVLRANGQTRVKVLEITGGSDLAEPFPASPSTDGAVAPKPGMILSIDAANPGALRVATDAYDTAVAGVYSGGNGLPTGMLMGKEGCDLTAPGEDKLPLAMTGRVWVYADESAGEIRPGDRLTTSGTKPGHAMKVTDASRADGAVIGKAMTPIDETTGMVLVLVNLQ